MNYLRGDMCSKIVQNEDFQSRVAASMKHQYYKQILQISAVSIVQRYKSSSSTIWIRVAIAGGNTQAVSPDTIHF